MTGSVRACELLLACLVAASPLRGQAKPYRAVAVGGEHTCAITAASTVVCWGRADKGQLGVTTDAVGNCSYACKTSPTLSTGAGFRAVTAGALHTCALMEDGLALCAGEVSDVRSLRSFTPVEGGPWLAISAGTTYTCAVAAADSTGWCWGRGKEGQLGNGTLVAAASPTRISSDLKFTEISAGTTSTCGIVLGGGAWCWGRGKEGQLGNDAVEASPVPVEVKGGHQLVHVDVGAQHACGLGVDSTVACWGRASGGALGPGVKKNSPTPVAIQGHVFKAVTVGDWFTCALAPDGAVYCFGYGMGAELGNSSTSGAKWRAVGGGELRYGFRSIEAGGKRACGIVQDYSLWCWGDALNGEIGNGETIGGSTPKKVLLPPG